MAFTGALLGIAANVALCGAQAQTRTVAEIANYKGADRQQVLEAGAKREGLVMLYSTGTQIQPLVDRFIQKYPYLRVELPRGSAEDIVRKAFEEYRAGVHNADVFELAAPALIIPRSEGLLQPFWSPEAADYAPDTVEQGRHWIVSRESYIGIGYNPNLIRPEDAPKSYADMLDPKWKGKMAMSSTNGTAANWLGVMALSEGMDYVRKLSEQDIRVYNILSRGLANLTISGEAPISPTIYDSHVLGSRAQGAPIAWIAPGAVHVADGSVAVASTSPHPHAAMLLMDLLLSREGQLIYQEMGYAPSRPGVGENRYSGLKKLYLSNRPNYLAEYEGWVKLVQELFVRRAGAQQKP